MSKAFGSRKLLSLYTAEKGRDQLYKQVTIAFLKREEKEYENTTTEVVFHYCMKNFY